MAKTKHDTKEEKMRLKDRAEMLKPRNVPNVVATERGWAHPRPNGTLELLVSFNGLDALLGDIEPEVVEAPIEVKVLAPVEQAAATEDKKEDESEPVVVPKKAGRPKKVAE